jgi:hypothetical protein
MTLFRPRQCLFRSTMGNVCLLICLLFVGRSYGQEAVDFSLEIRQILSDKCFLCHGPSEETREAELRLDVRESAITAGAIKPGQALESKLLQRVASSDPDQVMPPPATGKKITAAEQELLKRWIEQGAQYSEHWAFIPPQRPQLPSVKRESWVRNPIDRFVLAEQERRGLEPSPAADRFTLARRLYLDLIGIAPLPHEIDDFLAGDPEKAYRDLTAQLLESEHFGERWARWWLDAARYSDSDGYEKDKPRSVWFYRDWVIRAMNQNMPYDQFIIRQLAGDLLPDAGQDERVATGFLRNSMVNEEGGADPEQFRIEGMFDRMDAIGKSILGITTQCAQCHTHKYDPLSQREYYQMFAAFNDFHEATMTAFTDEQAKQRDEVYEQIAAVESAMKNRMPDWAERMREWEQSITSHQTHWRTIKPESWPYEGQKFRVLDDGSIISESYAPTRVTDTFTAKVSIEKITAIRLDALQHPQLPRGGPGRSVYGTGAVTEFEVSIAPADKPNEKRKIKFARALADVNPERSHLPAIYRDKDAANDKRVTGPIEYAIDGVDQTAWSTDIGPGRRNQNRLAVFIPAEPIMESGEVELSFTLKQNHGGWNSDDNQNYLLGRFRFSITDGEVADQLLPSEIESILSVPHANRTQQQHRKLFSYWRTTIPEFAEQNAEIENLWQMYPESDTQLVVQAVERPRETYVFVRGDFLNKSERVLPDAPKFLGELAHSNEPARLRLARWLVRPESPTTARVLVNRIWQMYFGRGLVATPEDFGFQSSPPSHPQLLDWLATELVESKWNLKHIHQLIVESATYQQSSNVSPEMLASDASNTWLARGPRLRVDAESVRDSALRVAGLLNTSVGGPSVFPPAPGFLFEPPASYGPKIWPTSIDGVQYRRSMYVHSYRSVAYPPLQVFDAPKGDAACIRRERSNTPLQALVLLNEPQFVECARAMAAKVLREGGETDDARLQYAHRLAVTRPAEREELKILQELLDQQRKRLMTGDLSARDLIAADPAIVKQLTGSDASELAAWMIVSRVLLNLDEAITKP